MKSATISLIGQVLRCDWPEYKKQIWQPYFYIINHKIISCGMPFKVIFGRVKNMSFLQKMT